MIAALVLAGGEAKRFQTQSVWQDKALALIDDEPFLVHVIQNLQGAVDKVAVSVSSPERLMQYRQVLEKHRIKGVEFVLDQVNSPVKGPLLDITSGLKAVDSDYMLVVPTDMPFLQSKVAGYLLDSCRGFDAAVSMWPDGTLETLLIALEHINGQEIAETLLALGKANANSIPRATAKLHLISPLKEINQLDPQLKSFININTQQDLTRPKTRSTEGSVKGDICFDRGLYQSSS
jgi:molybdopterin-guanine dinucleotide biosynthesis protein A